MAQGCTSFPNASLSPHLGPAQSLDRTLAGPLMRSEALQHRLLFHFSAASGHLVPLALAAAHGL